MLPGCCQAMGGHCLCAPTNGLGALEISLLFYYSLTSNGLGALSCSIKMSLKWVPFKICNSSPECCQGPADV